MRCFMSKAMFSRVMDNINTCITDGSYKTSKLKGTVKQFIQY